MGGLRDQGCREGFQQLIPAAIITAGQLQIAGKDQGFRASHFLSDSAWVRAA